MVDIAITECERFFLAFQPRRTAWAARPRTRHLPRPCWSASARHDQPGFARRMGLKTSSPTKSFSLSVTTTQPFACATAAMIMSSALLDRPLAIPSAIRRAQISPAWASKSQARGRRNRVGGPLGAGKPGLPPTDRVSCPAASSSRPRQISATVRDAMNRSSSVCSVSHASRASDGRGLVTLLMTFVSSRYRVTDRPCGHHCGGRRFTSRWAPTRGERRSASSMPPLLAGWPATVRLTVALIWSASGPFSASRRASDRISSRSSSRPNTSNRAMPRSVRRDR